MANQRLKDLRGPARRDFIRWAGLAGAAVALERSKLLNFLADEGGTALAADACPAALRSVHWVGGNGAFAWMQLLWPHLEVAGMQTYNPKFAWHAPNEGFLFGGSTGTDKPFYYGPEAPWTDQVSQIPQRPVTAFMAGKDETHTKKPTSAVTVGGGRSMMATVASMQSVMPVPVPVIGIEPLEFGNSPGAPAIATVTSASAMLELFSSQASKLTLAAQKDKDLFETYYKAFLGLRCASGRSSWAPHIDITKKSAKLLGFDFNTALKPSAADLTRYGIDSNATINQTVGVQKAKLVDIGIAMIITAKAFALGLTNSVIIAMSPGPTSDTDFTDPHQVFNNMTALRATVKTLGTILNAFYADLAVLDDPICTGQKMDKSVVFTAHGDTAHNPLVKSGWPDATPKGSNWLYVMGNGYLADGWFGGVKADANVDGFDPTTGQTIAGQSGTVTASAAGAAVAYAVAKGNMNLVTQYYSGPPITALVKKP